jgi:hypothetical protein
MPKLNQAILKQKEQWLHAFSLNFHNVEDACIVAQCARRTYLNWLKNDAKFKERQQEILDGYIDLVENALMKKVQTGDLKAIIYYLDNQGKERGWQSSEKVTHTGSVDVHINKNVIESKATPAIG